MKERLKNKIEDAFIKDLESKYPNIGESTIYNIAHSLSDIANTMLMDNNEGLKSMVSNAVTDLEQHRKQFQEHVEYLQKSSTKILEVLKSKALITYEYDLKKKKNILKGRTAVLNEMIEYMNLLNDMVIAYYKNVYKIEQGEDRTIQTSLF
jgi:hypothetical protein